MFDFLGWGIFVSNQIGTGYQISEVALRVLVVRRIIKIFANFLKIACYGFHWLFPQKRFTLPAHSAPLASRLKNQLIPATIWQTNFTNRVTLPVYLNYLFNRIMAPRYEYRFMITSDRENFVETEYPGAIFESYKRLQIGASQADFWRVLVLQRFGGVYLDIDAHFIWPAQKLIKPNNQELFLQIKTGEISNYFIASKPDNPHLAHVIRQITANITSNSSANVYDLTGPGAFNHCLGSMNVQKVYYLRACNQGNFTNEHFQYIDKPQGKWTKEQQTTALVSKND
jgi:mannosyltransferase OCH1-like enzyme